jgi:uncharacterized protein
VLEVDIARKRIALTMRLTDEVAPKRDHAGSGAPRRGSSPPPRREEAPAGGAMAAAFAKLKR